MQVFYNHSFIHQTTVLYLLVASLPLLLTFHILNEGGSGFPLLFMCFFFFSYIVDCSFQLYTFAFDTNTADCQLNYPKS